MARRQTRHVLKNNSTNNGSLPSSGVYMGEPLVNLYNGILFFSGATGGNFVPSDNNSTYFEVGSNLYDLQLRNQITRYQNITGAGLAGKFLSGTTTGFVLADISAIQGIDSYLTGATWSPNTLTLSSTEGKPNVTVTIDSFNNINLYGTTNVNGNITVTGTSTFNGLAYYNNTASASNEIVNYGLLTAYSQTNDVYVTGSTLTSATNNSDTQTSNLLYHGTPIGGPYSIVTENTFTTGGTYNNSSKNITFTRNDAVQYTVDLSTIDTNDTYVTGGTNNAATNNTNSASIGLKYNQDIPDGTYSLPYTDSFTTGGTLNSNILFFTRNDGTVYTVDLNTLAPTGTTALDKYVTGFTYNNNNIISLTQSVGGPSFNVDISTLGSISASAITVSNLAPNRVVYTNGAGYLATETGFEYNEGTDRMTVGAITVNNSTGTTSYIGQGGLVIGSGGSSSVPGIGSLTVHGDLTVFGDTTTISTSELYVEDPQITINYNPTGDTSITSIASGLRIQDGDGSSNDVYLTVAQMNTFTGGNVSEYTGPNGYSNRAFLTQLNDIVIRNTNLNNGAPDGVRVLAEFDILDGGLY